MLESSHPYRQVLDDGYQIDLIKRETLTFTLMVIDEDIQYCTDTDPVKLLSPCFWYQLIGRGKMLA